MLTKPTDFSSSVKKKFLTTYGSAGRNGIKVMSGPKDVRPEGSEKFVNLTREARELLGGGVRESSGEPRMSRAKFAAKIGVSESTIVQRESREHLSDTASVLCRLIKELCKVGLRADVNAVLESVPANDRNEARSLTGLTLLAVEKGHHQAVKRVHGGTVGKSTEEDQGVARNHNDEEALLDLEATHRSIEAEAREADGAEGEWWREAQRSQAATLYNVKQAIAARRAREEAERAASEPPGETG